MFSNELIFLGLIFLAVILLSQALFLPVSRPRRANTALIRKRLKQLSAKADDTSFEVSLLRKSKLKKLSDFGRKLESIEFFENLSYRLEVADYKMMGHQFFTLGVFISTIAAMITWYYINNPFMTAIIFIITSFLFNIKLNRDTDKRMDIIEASFPDGLDVIRRALQAGYSFTNAIKLATEEMEGPLAKEFNLMFININYTKDLKRSLLAFIQRVPSVSALAFASAVMVQRETGGNLAENIENLTRVIRQRFTFRRRVKTLSAEGRLSAWILILLPFVLFAVIYIQTPSYVGELTGTEAGQELLMWGGVGMTIGGWWISKIIKIDV
ncbi:type II secretion system F family protein [Shewanella surugensis]|uniref:Type II secretion system F family protein n=1 Tax=Shewanella surugensis TaxID=212020 RepID=A0ABT0LHW8_9GAMM|nr:type II secretion system F family protein [Shewanella surugensis]MCL1127306.1 type II secretion system F family protein [Shewanella surugensis]